MESRQKKPPVDLQLAHTDAPQGRRSRSGTFGSVDVGAGDSMDATINHKHTPHADYISNGGGGGGGRSRSGTQNSTSPVKAPGVRSRSSTVGSSRGLDAVICADASAKAVSR